jgi:hypothetical protein
MASMILLDLMGGVALLLWGLHMVHSGIVRDLKRIHSHICPAAYPVLERAGELQPSRLKAAADPSAAIAIARSGRTRTKWP